MQIVSYKKYHEKLLKECVAVKKSLFIILGCFFLSTTLFASNTNTPKIFAGSCGNSIAKEISDYLKLPLHSIKINHFNDGEIKIKIEEDVKNQDVYVMRHSRCS
jgi:hypothetical protein